MSLTPQDYQKIVKEKRLTKYLSIGIMDDGRIMTIINGKPFIQCRRALFTAPSQETEERLRARMGKYKNMDEFLASRSEVERDEDLSSSIMRMNAEQHIGFLVTRIKVMVETRMSNTIGYRKRKRKGISRLSLFKDGLDLHIACITSRSIARMVKFREKKIVAWEMRREKCR